MATRVADSIPSGLRYEPTPKWIRGERDGALVVDSRRALLVWEPGNVVPGYAFPVEDVSRDAIGDRVGEIEDGDLAGYVAVDWDAADRWLEEDEEVVGHPRDPFHRVDVRRSSRHVVVSLDGEVFADSRRPVLLFETGLPVRYYLEPDDVRLDALEESSTRTTCAYKGHASYLSAPAHPDIAWTYREPLEDAEQIRGLIAFFNERARIVVDGEPQERPRTQWS